MILMASGSFLVYHYWPFVHKSEYDRARLENFVLDVLREANAELYKHRQLIVGLKTGQKEITEQFERAIQKQ